MSLLGVNDLKELALPLGWDAEQLAQYALADGTTYDQVVENIAQGLVVANNGLVNDPVWGGMMHITPDPAVEYRSGSGGGMSERTEYQYSDAQRAATSGHMLPIKSFDRGLGWSFDFLRKARASQLEADIADALYDMRDNWEAQLLQRFFDSSENAIGSGYNVPFVNGNGGNVVMTPPPYAGQTFSDSHTHFDRKTTTQQAQALEAGAKHLWEHGIFGPYSAIIPFADIGTYTALSGFIKPNRGVEYISVGANAPYAQAALEDERFIGLYESDYGLVRLWITPHLPTNYLGIYKPYGINDPRNALKVRYANDLGAGAILMRGEGFRQFPLEHAIVLHEFGVGVGNRLNGYACHFAASGGYVAPSIG